MGDSRDDDDPLGIGGGDIEPMSPVDVARMSLAENPIWRQNRPGHWGRGKEILYHGFHLLAIAAAVVGMAATISLGALPIRAMAILSFLLIPVQCLATFVMIHAFDFLRSRKGALEEIALTGLGMSDIAYGSYAAGARGAACLLIPLLVSELWMWVAYNWEVYIVAIVLLPPFRTLLYCHATAHTLARLTSARTVDVAFLASLPFLCAVQAALCILLGFFSIPGIAYLLGPRSGFGDVGTGVAALFFTALGYAVAILWGRATLTRGWRAATENLYRRMEM